MGQVIAGLYAPERRSVPEKHGPQKGEGVPHAVRPEKDPGGVDQQKGKNPAQPQRKADIPVRQKPLAGQGDEPSESPEDKGPVGPVPIPVRSQTRNMLRMVRYFLAVASQGM